jgi:hypothetical protein
MRKILGFGVVLAAAYLTGHAGVAYGQRSAGAQVGAQAERAATSVLNPTQTPAPNVPGTTPNNVVQQATQAAGLSNPATTAPGVPGQTAPGVPGQVTGAVPGQTIGGAPAPGTVTTTPGNTYQVPGMTGTAVNPAGTVTNYPGAPTSYSSNYYQAGTYPGTYTGATPGYTNQIMPGMAGFNSVNPMGTTMAPGYYYAGTGGMPYATSNTAGYTPTNGNTGSYTRQPFGNMFQQRRGLFGGLFRRRNRVSYPATTFGSPLGTTPYGYTTYSNTTYYTAPGSYVYGSSPY